MEQIVINNFNAGIITDVDETENGIENSVYDAQNMDFDTKIGTAYKRHGIKLSSYWDESTVTADGYTVKILYEFNGKTNNIVKMIATNSGNKWKIWYKDGNASWVQAVLDSTSIFVLGDNEEPFFESMDGCCRIGLGIKNDPVILYYSDGGIILDNISLSAGWRVGRTIPSLLPVRISTGEVTSVSHTCSWIMLEFTPYNKQTQEMFGDGKLRIDFSNPGAGFPFSTITLDHTATTHTTGSNLVVACKSAYDLRDNMHDAVEKLCECIVSALKTSTVFANDFTLAVKNDGGGWIKWVMEGYPYENGNSKNFGNVSFNILVPFGPATNYYDTAPDPRPEETVETGIVNDYCNDMKKGTYNFKYTCIWWNEESAPIDLPSVYIGDERNKIYIEISIPAVNTIDPRYRAIRLYVKREAEEGQYTDNSFKLLKEISLSKPYASPADLKYISSIGAGSNLLKWYTVGGYCYIGYVLNDQNDIRDEMLDVNLSRDYDDVGGKPYIGSVYHKGRRYIWGCDSYRDRIYYSLITSSLMGFPQLDIFPKQQYISVGDEQRVTYVTVWRQHLLVFTETTLLQIDAGDNTAQNISIIDTFVNQGCPNPKTIVFMADGIFWSNEDSIWLFRGSRPEDLLYGKWKSGYTYSYNQFAGYCGRTDTIWYYHGSWIIYVYNVKNRIWTRYMANTGTPSRFYAGMDKKLYIPHDVPIFSDVILEYPSTIKKDYNVSWGSEKAFNTFIITQELKVNSTYHKIFNNIKIEFSNESAVTNNKVVFMVKQNGICINASGLDNWGDNAETPGGVLLGNTLDTKYMLPYMVSKGIQLKIATKTDTDPVVIHEGDLCIKNIVIEYSIVDEVYSGREL